MKYVVICNNDDGRSIVLITESSTKAYKLAERLQEKYDPNFDKGVVFEVEYYKGFKKENW